MTRIFADPFHGKRKASEKADLPALCCDEASLSSAWHSCWKEPCRAAGARFYKAFLLLSKATLGILMGLRRSPVSCGSLSWRPAVVKASVSSAWHSHAELRVPASLRLLLLFSKAMFGILMGLRRSPVRCGSSWCLAVPTKLSLDMLQSIFDGDEEDHK